MCQTYTQTCIETNKYKHVQNQIQYVQEQNEDKDE